ncbi:MAG: pyrroline-5-carboxylate reductase [Austwickia sp.]|nr:pyrroline-5-carboxylate reductase [Austwickia sp.]MBK9100271.1 pyrroline-5-carboxylate reductase [Austwickia sp.]
MATNADQPRDAAPRLVVAVLGAGVMGGAVLTAILDAHHAGPGDVRVSTLDPEAADRWRARGVLVTGNAEAVDGADVVVVATKPADVAGVLDEAGPRLKPGAVVISLAAGVRLALLEGHLPAGTAVVRVMPNTPAVIGEGMSALSPGASCSPEQLELAQQLLGACGQVVTVPESAQNAVTAVSGSGPAYLFYLLEAMIDAGVLLGLSRPVATELAVQTAYGAASMVRRNGTHPGLLREQVTSPGGTTAAALRTLDAKAVKAAMMEAIEAAARRSAELA